MPTKITSRGSRRCCPSKDIIPFSECRNQLSAIFAQVHKTRRPVLVTQNGRAASYIIDAEEYDALNDKIDLYEDIAISRRELAEGKGIPGDIVNKEMHELICRVASKRRLP